MNSYNNAPKEYMSHIKPCPDSRIISGDKYSGLPQNSVESQYLLNPSADSPKSVSWI